MSRLYSGGYVVRHALAHSIYTPRTIIPHPPQCTSTSRISSKLTNITSLQFENPKVAVLRLRYLDLYCMKFSSLSLVLSFLWWRTMFWTNWEICSCLLTTVYSSGGTLEEARLERYSLTWITFP